MRIGLFLALAVTALIGGRAAAAPGEPLAWEAPSQFYTAKPGEVSARFVFKVSNVSTSQVVIDDVITTCGCTVAQFPTKPWTIKPGAQDKAEVLVDLRGRYGKLFKEISVVSSNAPKLLTVLVDIPEPGTNALSVEAANRLWGQQLAAVDHQAVFKKDCVKCHLEPAFGKFGEDLFHVACGICHEAAHRATMVPDLTVLKTEIDGDYWRNWVTHGKPGSLMPGFAAKEGGPLNDRQIDSLVEFLTNAFPRPLKTAALPVTGK
jgi:hypothetical protein